MGQKRKRKPPPPPSEGAFGETVESPTLPSRVVLEPPKGGRPWATTVEAPESPTKDYLRYSAGIFYTTDLGGCTLDDMLRHPIYRDVPRRTLEFWSQHDKWGERRKAVRADWQKIIEDRIGNELAKARAQQLEAMMRVYNVALRKLETEAVEAKSWEGVVMAFTRLIELMEEFREKIGRDLPPVATGMVTAMSPVRPKLTSSEARAAAMEIVRMRMTRTEQEQVVESGAADPEGKNGGRTPVE